MIDYLIAYFAVGVGFFVAIFAFVLIRDGRNALDFPHGSPLELLLALLVIFSTWPAIMVYLIYETVKSDTKRFGIKNKPRERPKFRVEPQNLIRRMSVVEIETHERIHDSFGAVPDLPFGHLHKTWTDFVGKIEPSDDIWSFEAEWRPETERPRHFRGYASLRENVISSYLITRMHDIKSP